jgi:ATP-dependent Lhr-like helicase
VTLWILRSGGLPGKIGRLSTFSVRCGATLQRLCAAKIVVTTPKRFSPLSFPLLVDRRRNNVSSEKLSDRIKRMQLALEKAAG